MEKIIFKTFPQSADVMLSNVTFVSSELLRIGRMRILPWTE